MELTIVDLIKQEIHLRLVEESIPRILQCLNTVSDKQVWEKPNSQSNSIGTLILHLCGNVRQYLVSSIGGQPDLRNRASEFTITDLSKAQLESELLLLKDEIGRACEKITDTELLRSRKVQAFEMTGLSITVHVIEHFSYHTGQIAYITKMLQDVDLKFYGDLDLDMTC